MPAPTPLIPPRLPLPDLALARRALGEVRSAMRTGFGLVRETVDRAPLPAPVAAVAGKVLRQMDDLAQHADSVASTAVHGLLAVAGIDVDGPAARLSAALRGALAALGETDLRVSDAAVREALAGVRAEETPKTPEQAAAVMRRLLAAGAVRSPAGADPAEAAPPVFAALLAELQGHAVDPGAIAVSRAIADALATEIRGAWADETALARLFAEFRDHV